MVFSVRACGLGDPFQKGIYFFKAGFGLDHGLLCEINRASVVIGKEEKADCLWVILF